MRNGVRPRESESGGLLRLPPSGRHALLGVGLGSAATLHTAHRGLEDRQVRLGCAQPGESVATFGDALRRLTDQATHLYVDGRRYWYSTQPSVTRLAQDRAAQQDPETVHEEIRWSLREAARQRGDFARIHVCSTSNADVPDEREARLVILDPAHPHATKMADSPARLDAVGMLEQRGSSPRRYRNTLVFLAADRIRLGELEQAVREYLAWKSIEDERETLNLDAFQANQARTKRAQAEETVQRRLPETYQWLLVPGQADPQAPLAWPEIRLQGQDALAVRAAKKLKNDGLLITQYAGTLLRLELERVLLWRGEHVSLKQLAEDFALYMYLPRLQDANILLGAIRDGVGLLTWQHESFAYADGWDAEQQRYRGLRAGEIGSITLEGASVLVKPDVAARQMAEDQARAQTTSAGGAGQPYPPNRRTNRCGTCRQRR